MQSVLNKKYIFNVINYNTQISRKKIILRYTSSKNHQAFMKTHVISNYIEHLNNDINMVNISMDNDDTEYQCKYIHYFRLILIIVLIIFMFTGPKEDDKDKI
jgi:hypothetical protein